MPAAIFSSPVGPLGLESAGGRLTHIRFRADGPAARAGTDSSCDADAVLSETARQLAAYFARRLRQFDLPLSPAGTAFQRQVWDALVQIPYGETISYGELARQLGRATAIRAVGAANGRNPIPIVIPCHRVIGSTGRLVGFGGGIETKEFLLTLERLRLF